MVRVRIGDEEHELSWEEWEARVRAGRIPGDALVQFEAVTGSAWVPAKDLEMYRSLRNDAALAWQGRFLTGPAPVLTALLVGVQIRIWWFNLLPSVRSRVVWRFTNWTAPTLEDGEVWRLLTMGLLHTELLHILLNMLWLFYTGWNIERALGRANLLVLYFASVLGGSLLSMFASPETPSLGASGGVFGLVAASVVFGFLRPDLLPRRGRRLFGAAMLPYLVAMFLSGLVNEDTDNWSHLGGLLTGGVLALLLDPEPLQRRARWNGRVRGAVVALSVAVLLTLGAFGPRLYPLLDSERARQLWMPRSARTEVEPEAQGPLHFEAPMGWKPLVNAAGDSAFVSPVGPRSWSVSESSSDRLRTTEELAEDWLERLRRGWPEAEVGPLEPAEVAGLPGLERRVRVGHGDEARELLWRGTTRGVWGLQQVWEVPPDRVERLAPLRDRLVAAVRWEDPTELVEARREVEHLPRSVSARSRLAEALLRVGAVDEALDLLEELLEEAPAEPERWEALLAALSVAGPALEEQTDRDPLDLVARSLAPPVSSRRVVEAVVALEALGHEETATGLLVLAWNRTPGDRRLERARRSRGLSTELDASGRPWELVNDPLTGAPRDEEEIEAGSARALDLETAARVGSETVAARERLVETIARGIRAGDPSVALPLLYLEHGRVPAERGEALASLRTSLEDLEITGGPRWLPKAIAEALAEHPGWIAQLGDASP